MNRRFEKWMYTLSLCSVLIYVLVGAIYAFSISFIKGVCVLLAYMCFMPILLVVYKKITEDL